MTDTLWADVSNWQTPVNDAYPYQVLSIRANDGAGWDAAYAANRAWALAHLGNGVLINYAVWRPDGGNWAQTLINRIGTPSAIDVCMVDVERWNIYSGDHSADINAGVAKLQQFMGDARRVIGYGNAGDLAALWPNRALATPDHLILAAYGAPNSFGPAHFAHQFSSNDTQVPPWAPKPVDINSADGMDINAVRAFLGITGTVVPPQPHPNPIREDGILGPETITRWQEIMGTPVDGVISTPYSVLVAHVQERLNSAGARDWNGRALNVDGNGIFQNNQVYRTVWALQVYMGTFRDGKLSTPVSECIKAVQSRLNSGTF